MVSQSLIARRVKVSQRTVSLCLSGSGRVSDATRKKVLAVAEELGYRPNRSALAMRSGRFNAVALLQSRTRPWLSFLPGPLLKGLQDELGRHEIQLVLASVPDEQLDDDKYLPTVFREWSVDGFLVNYDYNFPPRLAQVLDANNLPAVWINCKRSHDCVYPDDVGAGRKITEHLLGLGHRKIAFFTHRTFDGHYSVADRYAGYEQALRAAGLEPRLLLVQDFNWDVNAGAAVKYMREILAAPDRPTAVVAYGGLEGYRTLLAAYKLDMEVPDDLSIATFHHAHLNDGGFPLTTMMVPEVAVGLASADLLLRRIGGAGARQPATVIQFSKITGASVGPPRGGLGSAAPR